MSVRGILSRQRYTYSILYIPLPNPIHHRRYNNNPPSIPPRNRLKQSNRTKLKHRQNPIPPILHIQRHPSHSTTYQTRMILLICLRNPAIHPK
uniref:Uncharacterized protein n=1 Tax=Pelusios castaneus TaxID=367368 RepID=A0A8C8RZB8_9SAUR